MNDLQKNVIKLIKSALTGEKYQFAADLDIDIIVKIAKKHQIQAIVYYGALNCGLSNDLPEMQKLFLETCGFISISAQQMHELKEIFQQFDVGKIEYMPLKGTVLKALYAKPEMRVMSDADILIRTEQYNIIKPIMEKLGYAEAIESDHELIWKKGKVTIELHKRLIPSYNKDYYAYFGDGWRLGKPVSDDSTRYAMSIEDEMIYLFTHYAKHYRDAGIGIKHIVDLWVYRNSVKELNNEYVLKELKKLQLDVFYENTMRTLDVWFKDVAPDNTTEFITGIIFNSGVYGTHEAHLLSEALKVSKQTGTTKKVRTKKIIQLMFLPYKSMCQKYPFLEKAKILLPVMWVVRWFNVLLFKHQKIKKNQEDLKIMSVEKIDNYQKALNFVGLDFNFEE
ncbi:MAG: hypothetical protein E7561_03270 [Ruminococcaceae bacterium]|nr:hypothetical protein [Oscillospiraceae bacterium]